MTQLILERSQLEIGLVPVADAFAGTVSSDVVSFARHERVRFLVFWGVGATGTVTLTVEACDNVTPSTTSAVPFRYRRLSAAGQAPGAITAVAATGILTTAGSDQIYECEVAAEAMLASGYGFVRLKSIESVNSPLLGGILIEMLDAKFAGSTHVTATA